MKLFLDYLNKIKLQILLMLFPTILTGMIFLLYQLPLEPILYIAVLWILTGLGTCAFGFHNYQKNIHNLQIISAAPDINLSRMDAPSNEADALIITRCGHTRSRHQFLLCVCSFRKIRQ